MKVKSKNIFDLFQSRVRMSPIIITRRRQNNNQKITHHIAQKTFSDIIHIKKRISL